MSNDSDAVEPTPHNPVSEGVYWTKRPDGKGIEIGSYFSAHDGTRYKASAIWMDDRTLAGFVRWCKEKGVVK